MTVPVSIFYAGFEMRLDWGEKQTKAKYQMQISASFWLILFCIIAP